MYIKLISTDTPLVVVITRLEILELGDKPEIQISHKDE